MAPACSGPTVRRAAAVPAELAETAVEVAGGSVRFRQHHEDGGQVADAASLVVLEQDVGGLTCRGCGGAAELGVRGGSRAACGHLEPAEPGLEAQLDGVRRALTDVPGIWEETARGGREGDDPEGGDCGTTSG